MTKNAIITVAFFGALTIIACSQQPATDIKIDSPKESTASKFAGYESQVKWGEHLVNILGCEDCHTPKKMTPMGPVPDSSLTLSGHISKMPPPDVDRKMAETKGLGITQTQTAWVGPWGISYSGNLTSDSTGIGTWTEEQFVYSIRNGKYKGLVTTRTLLPPMPWPSYRNMTDNELKAVFAFLKSTKPVHNVVPNAEAPLLARK